MIYGSHICSKIGYLLTVKRNSNIINLQMERHDIKQATEHLVSR